MLERKTIRDAIRYEGGLTRRLWLAYAGALAAAPLAARSAKAEPAFAFSQDPFQLGVASGDPDAHSVVLWTRLAPEPLQPGGGMPTKSIEVAWEIARDESMRLPVAAGTTMATPQLGHCVHVEVDGLQPDRWYWYRFRAGDAVSPIGRTRTLPAPDTMPSRLKFAFTSCQNFEQGLYTAYEQMASDDVDLVFHLGDYIYEYQAGRNGKVRTHVGPEIQSLEDYRIRLSQYRSDPLLHGMHGLCPWFVTWDDHEFDNNYAGAISEEDGIDPVEFLVRRANSYQAYYEMMPLRRSAMPRGDQMRIYRSASFGQLAELLVLDTRQYRTDQPNNDRRSPLNEMALRSSNTMLGRRQANWLSHQLINSRAQWNVLAQQVMMGMVARTFENGEGLYSMDQWPGYAAERMRLVKFLEERRISNPVVLTGDIHTNWANELRVDDRRPEDKLVATEFVATSLSSGGNGVERPSGYDAMMAANPCVKFHNGERGYVRCTVTPDSWLTDFVVTDDVEQPGGKNFTRASFVVEAGDPSLKSA